MELSFSLFAKTQSEEWKVHRAEERGGNSLRLVSLQHLLKLLRRRLLHGREAVRVRIKRQNNRGVAQSLADDLRILICGKKKRRAGMTEIICADVLQSRLF